MKKIVLLIVLIMIVMPVTALAGSSINNDSDTTHVIHDSIIIGPLPYHPQDDTYGRLLVSTKVGSETFFTLTIIDSSTNDAVWEENFSLKYYRAYDFSISEYPLEEGDYIVNVSADNRFGVTRLPDTGLHTRYAPYPCYLNVAHWDYTASTSPDKYYVSSPTFVIGSAFYMPANVVVCSHDNVLRRTFRRVPATVEPAAYDYATGDLIAYSGADKPLSIGVLEETPVFSATVLPGNAVLLEWEPYPYALRYIIYRSNSTTPYDRIDPFIVDAPGTSCLDESVLLNNTYLYRLKVITDELLFIESDYIKILNAYSQIFIPMVTKNN